MYENEQEKYLKRLLEELNLHTSSAEQQQEALETISERFQNVILYTALGAMNPLQKKEFSAALDLESPARENKIMEITAQVDNLKELIEEALEHEYEALKFAMSKA